MKGYGSIKGVIVASIMVAFTSLGASGDERGNQIAALVDATEAVSSARIDRKSVV